MGTALGEKGVNGDSLDIKKNQKKAKKLSEIVWLSLY